MRVIAMRKFSFFTILISILLPLAACALPGNKLEGRVLEAGTNKPLAGVIVIALWEGWQTMGGADSQTQCYHVDTATTDAQGVYRIKEAPFSLLRDKHVTLNVYKPGYIRSPEYFKQESYRRGIELMEVFKGTREERFAFLEQVAKANNCNAAGRSGKNAFPFYEALFFEARDQAATSIQKGKLQWFRQIAASYALSEDIDSSQGQMDKRTEQFLRDHLK